MKRFKYVSSHTLHLFINSSIKSLFTFYVINGVIFIILILYSVKFYFYFIVVLLPVNDILNQNRP